ncbi:MAG: 5'/3'-nucleotidase SurE [Hyphomicrobiaceae bacterium]|nr:5'/3'-nucleotidase SurE [Hyphomicrobiaceae bacterium]
MRILITNDDGINAPGLDVMQQIASELSDDVWTVAPETDQSGASHSLSLHEPLRLREVDERLFAVKGTPTDCAIMGVRYLLRDKPPDLVLSGVNAGQNMADDVTYSGTIAGAFEGNLLGVPSMALSLAYSYDKDKTRTLKWQTPMAFGSDLVRLLLDVGFPDDVVLNINFPDRDPEDVEGVVVTRQGRRNPDLLTIVDRMDTRGNPYYWLGFKRVPSKPQKGTDLWAIYTGRISVTPLNLNLTHTSVAEQLAAALAD